MVRNALLVEDPKNTPNQRRRVRKRPGHLRGDPPFVSRRRDLIALMSDAIATKSASPPAEMSAHRAKFVIVKPQARRTSSTSPTDLTPSSAVAALGLAMEGRYDQIRRDDSPVHETCNTRKGLHER